MRIKFWRYDLKLTHPWLVASGGKQGAAHIFPVAILELTDDDGTLSLGEASPASRYQETVEGCLRFFEKVETRKLSFANVEQSMEYVEAVSPGDFSAKSAINVALLDGASRKAGKALHDFLGVGFREKTHVTSFSIGLDAPEIIRKKVLEAAPYPILKLKMGGLNDKDNLKALREAAPHKLVRIDANEGWKTKEKALKMAEWLAKDGFIQFIEQPMPAATPLKDLAWLKKRSPLPLFADESFHSARDVHQCAEGFQGVNMKFCKTGGISKGFEALKTARQLGLKTMIGCMIETSILISAAAHLAELADYLDIDGNLLIANDPYIGVTAEKGLLSFSQTPKKIGLRVGSRT